MPKVEHFLNLSNIRQFGSCLTLRDLEILFSWVHACYKSLYINDCWRFPFYIGFCFLFFSFTLLCKWTRSLQAYDETQNKHHAHLDWISFKSLIKLCHAVRGHLRSLVWLLHPAFSHFSGLCSVCCNTPGLQDWVTKACPNLLLKSIAIFFYFFSPLSEYKVHLSLSWDEVCVVTQLLWQFTFEVNFQKVIQRKWESCASLSELWRIFYKQAAKWREMDVGPWPNLFIIFIRAYLANYRVTDSDVLGNVVAQKCWDMKFLRTELSHSVNTGVLCCFWSQACLYNFN